MGLRSGRRSESSRRLLEAMERVIALVPSSPKLQARLRKHKRLLLSVSAVAEEAHMSRAALYSLYPEVVREIQARRDKGKILKPTHKAVVEDDLKEKIRTLTKANNDLLSENASLLVRLTHAQERAKRAEERLSVVLSRKKGAM